MKNNSSYNSIFYPPGGILLWIIIFLELITFGMGMIGLAYNGWLDPDLFHESSIRLNRGIGTLNTLVLISSGYAMASSVSAFRAHKETRAVHFLGWSILGGIFFIGLKSWEYHEKLSLGLGMGENTFFTFYWLLTGFHFVHVLVALVILTWTWIKMKSQKSSLSLLDLEAAAAFWHMCDLIWLLLFPALYLIW
jgi:nitric oxide reductase NorE protein